MCAGEPLRPSCHIQHLEPVLETTTKVDQKVDAKGSPPQSCSSSSKSSFIASNSTSSSISHLNRPTNLEAAFPLSSRCLPQLPHVVGVSDEGTNRFASSSMYSKQTKDEFNKIPQQTHLTKIVKLEEFDDVSRNDLINLRSRNVILPFLSFPNQEKNELFILNNCVNKYSDVSQHMVTMYTDKRRQLPSSKTQYTKYNYFRIIDKLQFLLHQRDFVISEKIKEISSTFKRSFFGYFRQNFHNSHNHVHFHPTINNKRTLDRAEKIVKSRLKRFKILRKTVKERFKSNKPILLPLDSGGSEEKNGKSFDNKKDDITSSKKRQLKPRNSLPNLFSRDTPKASITNVKLGKNHEETSYLGGTNTSVTDNKSTGARIKDSFIKSSQNTIKLIDKFLEEASAFKFSRNDKQHQSHGRRKERTKSLSMEESVPSSSVRKSNHDIHTKQKSDENLLRENSDHKRFSTSVDDSFERGISSSEYRDKGHLQNFSRQDMVHMKFFDKPNKREKRLVTSKQSDEAVQRPTTLLIKSDIPSIRLSQNSPASDDYYPNTARRLSASLDTGSDKYNKHLLSSSDKEAPTSDLLRRLDTVLSEIVEQEKKKIQRCERLKPNRSADSLLALTPQRPVRRKPRKVSRDRGVERREKDIFPYKKLPERTPYRYVSASDLMIQHRDYFTDSKRATPRILKSESQPKLLFMRCYQPPRRKYKRRKVPASKNGNVMNAHSYSESLDDDSPATSPENEIRGDDEKPSSLESFEEGFSSISFSSPGGKEAKPSQAGLIDDEDDTCYGSDQISSDVIERGDATSKLVYSFKSTSKPVGAYSIDSAYTGSREATPDPQVSDQNFDSLVEERQNYTKQSCNKFDPMKPTTSMVQLINDSKRFILERIKESHSYSDSNINHMLSYYSKKWKHISEREMKIIVASIRSDLGVRVSPKECIEYLSVPTFNVSRRGSSCQNLNTLESETLPLRREISKEDILVDLTTTLPEYLKTYHHNRRPLSTSSSPEPYHYLSNRDLSGNLLKGTSDIRDTDGVTNFVFSKLPQHQSPNEMGGDENRSNNKDERKEERVHKEDDDKDQTMIDEEWIKRVVGEETFKEMESIINDIKLQGNQADNDPQDFEKMANELCRQFSITF